MKQVYVKFNSLEQVSRFVNLIDKFDADFMLGIGKHTVDAKSILGIATLDLSKPLRLRYDSDDARIREQITPFLAEDHG